MLTLYGAIPFQIEHHLRTGDRWLTPEGKWRRWNGIEWEELKINE